MASHEHLQQLHDEDDSSTSSSSSSSSSNDSVSASSIGPQDLNTVDAMVVDDDAAAVDSVPEKPKRRIKLSLRLPKTTQNGDTIESASTDDVSMEDNGGDDVGEEVISATVVPSDGEEAEDVVEATVVQEAPTVAAAAVPSSSTAHTQTKPTKSRRSPTPFIQAGRPVRLPPMSSPGLLIPPSTSGVFRGDADANGFTTPNSVFTRSMSLAGYTTEGRTQNPHRGSSVQRVVDDMFDSNILFSLHFPKIVPDELWNTTPLKKPDQDVSTEGKTDVDDVKETLPYMLIRALSKTSQVEVTDGDVTMQDVSSDQDSKRRKRKPCLSFSDMAPVSLTIPYPESYIQKRLKYIQQVEDRERAIVASQEATQAADEALGMYEEELASYNNGSKRSQSGGSENGVNGPPVRPQVPLTVDVPPIPVPPSPPRQSELEGASMDEADEAQHPIYLPKGKENFVAHLDHDCFHITNGRYYGLETNTISDPHFVGPNAPGISGLNVSAGTGLATSYIGSNSGSGSGASQAYYGGSVGGGSSGGIAGGSSKNAPDSSKGSAKKGSTSSAGNGEALLSKVGKKGNIVGPTPTSTSAELKRFMEQDDATLVEQMKVCIIRAAVYASRTGMHGGSFIGTNLETYPDVSKAFAAHAGLRPCNRCKNNKQGAYHCRLRRKHKDIDYDGGNSWGILAPLFEEKMEDLLQKG